MTGPSPDGQRLFVYGTLRPGEERWVHLEPYVAGDGTDTTVAGDVYDSGLGYPAARFGGHGRIHGRIYELRDVENALEHLDEVEGAVRGLYHRVTVRTADGTPAWAYECGEDALLVRRIEGGDWAQRSSAGSCG